MGWSVNLYSIQRDASLESCFYLHSCPFVISLNSTQHDARRLTLPLFAVFCSKESAIIFSSLFMWTYKTRKLHPSQFFLSWLRPSLRWTHNSCCQDQNYGSKRICTSTLCKDSIMFHRDWKHIAKLKIAFKILLFCSRKSHEFNIFLASELHQKFCIVIFIFM